MTASDANLFAETAAYYARFRPPYPTVLWDRMRHAFGLDGSGRLLDVGCGPGTIALALHADVADTLAIDVSAEMLSEGQRQAARIGITCITWRALPAELIGPTLGRFRLATFGQSLHWMNRVPVLERVYDVLEPGGGIAVFGSGSIWTDETPWARVVVEVLQRWLGSERRAGGGSFGVRGTARHEQMIAEVPFRDLQSGTDTYTRTVTTDAIIGELYSTSFASRAVLGADATAFESDLRARLAALQPDDRFEQQVTTMWLFAWKR